MFTAEELEECDIFPKKITFSSVLKCSIYSLVMSLAAILMYSFYSGRDFSSLVSLESMKYGTDRYFIEKLAKVDNRFNYNLTDRYTIDVNTYLKNPRVLIKDYILKSLPLIIKNVSTLNLFQNENFLNSYISEKQEVIVEHRQDPNGFLNKEELTFSSMTYESFVETAQNKSRSINYFLKDAYIEPFYENFREIFTNKFLSTLKNDLKLLPQGIKYTEGFDEMIDPGHYDNTENLFCQVKGDIDLMIVPAMQRNSVYPFKKSYGPPNYSATNFFKAEYGRFPNFKYAHRLYITLSQGDCVFVPAYWWWSIKTEINKHFVYLKFQFKSHSRWNDYIMRGLETEEI